MHPFTLVVAICIGLAFTTQANAQYHYPNPFFRGYPLAPQRVQDGRFLFGSLTTFTFTISTSTTTVTTTSVTTCTTSTAALSACSAAGGRRRRRRELYAQEDDSNTQHEPSHDSEANQNEKAITLSSSAEIENEPVRAIRQLEAGIPFSIQPTFGPYYSPEVGYEQAPIGRFFLAFGTATTTVTATSTSTSTLTAVCSSTTSFKTCS